MTTIKNNFLAIYLIGFFFTFNVSITAYINSTFLSGFVSEQIVGIFFTIASLLTILALAWIPTLLRKIGNFKITMLCIFTNITALLVVAFSPFFPFVAIAFIIHLILATTILFNLDVFLESFSKDNSTGRTRGSYLSIRNIAWVISPIMTGFVLTNGDYWKVYTLAILLVLPAIYLLYRNFRNFKDPKYEKVVFLDTLKILTKRKNVLKIFISNFILIFFFSWMVIYTPIYLHEHIGFSWGTIGIIFTIMLLPFALLEMPLGRLADKKFGEKEILSVGFIIMAVFTGILAFLTTTNPAIWAMLLFITRVGASMVEIMTETYFFKKIQSDDTNLMGLFRIIRPLAYVAGPLVASILLIFMNFNYLFLVLGIIILVGGLANSLTLVDTN